MILDKEFNQNFWVGHSDSEKGGQVAGAVPAIDSLLRQGICMALCYSWAEMCLKPGNLDPAGLFNQEGPAWQRRLSFQRAYDMTWYDQGRQQQYPQFNQILVSATTNFLSQNGNRDGLTISKALETSSASACQDALQALAPGKVYALMIVGDGNKSETTGVWAHVVGIGHPQAKKPAPIFFDPNQGQFNWNEGKPAVGQEIMENLDRMYVKGAGLNIRNYVVYEFAGK